MRGHQEHATNRVSLPVAALRLAAEGERVAATSLWQVQARQQLGPYDLLVEPVATQVDGGEPAPVVDITRLRVTGGTNTLLLDTGLER